MTEQEWLAERFEERRTRLRAVAYRMLGSLSEADDAVQEAWLRLSRADTSEVENLDGWLTTVVARVSLNMLRSRKGRREEPIGVRVPEPIIDRADGMNPEHEALLADSVGLALLVVLETLSPAERLAFVLHDIFAVPFDEIAPIVDRSPEAARQLASRARRRVRGETPVSDADLETQRGSSTRLPRLRATATSKRCSRCWTRTSCCARISAPRASRGRSAAPASSRGRPSSMRARGWSSSLRSSMEPPELSRSSTASRSRSGASRSGAARSSSWTSSPTRSGSAASI